VGTLPLLSGFRLDGIRPLFAVNPLTEPLRNARVAFVTTSGAHQRDQPAFDLESAAGDPSFRSVPTTTELPEIQLSHRGYNTSRVSEDKNTVLPLEHLRAAQREGRIGELAPYASI
jgi:D-proline reductase (dithiol) PrdB